MSTRIGVSTRREVTPIHTQVLTYFNEVLKASDPVRITKFESRYSEGKTLGSGRFGIIKKLYDKESRKFVAAKIVNLEIFDHQIQVLTRIKKRVDRFIKEYKRISEASTRSDKITDFFGIYSDLERIIIISEFAENGSVKDKLAKEGLPEDKAIKYFYQAAQGLAFLHSQPVPIVHRDVKAANLLLTASDNVKLGNFGLVRDLTVGGLGLAVASEITEDFRFTLLYVAPEVLKSPLGPAESSSYDTPSDIWALGCTFVEMLTRFPPYFEFYDGNIGFYKDVMKKAENTLEKQLPYDCFSLVPTASICIRFIINKVFDKSPSTRINAEGLINFLNNVDENNSSREHHLQEKFLEALETSVASKKTNTKKSMLQQITRFASISRKQMSIIDYNPHTVIEITEEEEEKERKHVRRNRKRKKRKKRNFSEDFLFCMSYFLFRSLYFTGILLKSILYVVIFVFIGLGTLATFFCLSAGVIFVIRFIAAYFCECDLNTPQILIISGIFLILLFALFFSCCMVALGEYKFRIANKSLRNSKFFVRRPSRDIRFLGIRLIKGKRQDLQLSSADVDDVDSALETIIPKKSEMEEFYEPNPSEQNQASDKNRKPVIIQEEPSRKIGTSQIYSKDLQDLYGDKPSPVFY